VQEPRRSPATSNQANAPPRSMAVAASVVDDDELVALNWTGD
jgi:hypothetical protein